MRNMDFQVVNFLTMKVHHRVSIAYNKDSVVRDLGTIQKWRHCPIAVHVPVVVQTAGESGSAKLGFQEIHVRFGNPMRSDGWSGRPRYSGIDD